MLARRLSSLLAAWLTFAAVAAVASPARADWTQKDIDDARKRLAHATCGKPLLDAVDVAVGLQCKGLEKSDKVDRVELCMGFIESSGASAKPACSECLETFKYACDLKLVKRTLKVTVDFEFLGQDVTAKVDVVVKAELETLEVEKVIPTPKKKDIPKVQAYLDPPKLLVRRKVIDVRVFSGSKIAAGVSLGLVPKMDLGGEIELKCETEVVQTYGAFDTAPIRKCAEKVQRE